MIALALLTAAPTKPDADTAIALACSMPSAVELAIVTLVEAAKVGALVPPVLAELRVSVETELLTRFSTTPTPTAMPKPAAKVLAMISAFSLAFVEAALIVSDPAVKPAELVLVWPKKAWSFVLPVIVRLVGSVPTAAAV